MNKKFPIIEALKEYKTDFHALQFLSLDSNSPFGNLTLSWIEIVTRIECVNDLIITLYTDFEDLHNQLRQTQFSTLDRNYRQKFYTEQIFYWLRKTADDLISLISVLTDYKTQNSYPKKIKISSIGEFLKSTKSSNVFNGDFDKFKPYLQKLNEISNCFKHSFINLQISNLLGLEYTVVHALALQYNDLSNQEKFYSLELRQVLDEYDNFLAYTKKYIKLNLTNPKPDKFSQK